MHFLKIVIVYACSFQGARKDKYFSHQSLNLNFIENIKYQKYYWISKYANTKFLIININIVET